MKTYAFPTLGDDARLETIDLPEPEPGDGEVVMSVETVAVNRLDLAVQSGKGPGAAAPLPYVPGIDPAGTVAAVGPDVEGLEVGMRVVAKPNVACLRCRTCLEGQPWACTRQTIIGVHRPGGFAPRVAIPAVNAIPLPNSVTAEQATAAIHSFPVALRMIKQAGGIDPGMRVVVIGAAGAVGSGAVQLGLRFGASVVGIVSGEAKARFVSGIGAAAIDQTTEADLEQGILEATGGAGPDLVLDTAGSPPLTQAALAALGWQGVYATCGSHAGGRIDLDLAALYRNRQRIVGSAASGYDDVREVLTDLDAGVIAAHIDSVMAVAEAQAAYTALRSRSNLGKIVLRHEGA